MTTLATEREQALRWLIANRRPDVSIEQAVRVMCMALPRDLTTLQILRRIAEEEDAKELRNFIEDSLHKWIEKV